MLFLVSKEEALQSQIGDRYGFCSPQFCLICTVFFFFYTSTPGPPLELFTDFAACPCVLRVVIVLRGWAGGFSLPCGSAAGCAITSEHIGRGKVGKSEQHLKWKFSRCFNSLFMVTLFLSMVTLFLSIK